MVKKKKKKDKTKSKTKRVSDDKNLANYLSGRVDFLRWSFLSLAILLLLGLAIYWAVEVAYAGKVVYGLKMGDDDLSGFSRVELSDYIDKKKEMMTDGLEFVGEGLEEQAKYQLSDLGVWLDFDRCEEEIWDYAKYQGFWSRTMSRIRAISGQTNFACDFSIDQFDYNNWLNDLRQKANEPAVSASVEKSEGQLQLIQSKDGRVMDEEELRNDLEMLLSSLDFAQINLNQVVDYPQISNDMAKDTLELAQSDIDSPMNWVYEDWQIDVSGDDIYKMLYFEAREAEEVTGSNDLAISEDGVVFYVGYDLGAVDSFLNNNAWMFEDRPIDAKLAMTEEGPVVVQEGVTGKMVNRVKLIEYLESSMGEDRGDVELPVEVMESVISTDNIDELGIKELIATGSSDFSYSPANRIHNISVGADTFDGMVLAPGEEFSFTSLIGSVDAANGYLPELVIAGNETRPEYGGGLCQVSTTMYRTALDAGFPITARTPHRYRVSYYEPAGQDATIYIPNPDLRFINDTDNYILIEAMISGSILTFNFYGTSDGRQVEVTDPVIYNITSPLAPEYIYTSSLPAGQKIQVDSAHYGADSIFYRYITYANGETKEEEIFSRYQAWPAKYKVGEGEVEDEGGDDPGLVDDGDAGLPDVDDEPDMSGTV